jgi:hypothetical protein
MTMEQPTDTIDPNASDVELLTSIGDLIERMSDDAWQHDQDVNIKIMRGDLTIVINIVDQ